MDKNYKSAEELLEEAATKYANEINKRPDGSINVIRADISYDDFKEGAKWYASQFQHEAETVYVWVKADKEPLPEGKQNQTLSIKYKGYASSLIWVSDKWYWRDNRLFELEDCLGNLEWLKEVPLSSIKQKDSIK